MLIGCLGAEKAAQVSKIEWEQKITEKKSQQTISEIEGQFHVYDIFIIRKF